MIGNLFFSTVGQPLVFFGLLVLWALGGFLLVRSWYNFSTRESAIIGVGVGFCLVIVLTNLAAHGLKLQVAYSLAGGVIFAAGIISYRFYADRLRIWGEWKEAIPPVLVFLCLFWLFLKINQGLAIFDENYNLPIVSRIAAGDMPPHFPFDPAQPLAYHYGLHILAGITVKLGGFSPWFAFDAWRAFTHALLWVLAFFWFERQTGRFWAATIGAAVIYFGGTTQWLLLFAPQGWVEKLNSLITLTNTALDSGKSLSDLLVNHWNIEGLGVISFPFIFIGSLFKPQNLALTSNGACVGLTVLLLLLLVPRQWRWGHLLIVSLVLGSLALTAEYLFGLVALGSGLVALLAAAQQKNFSAFRLLARLWILPSALALFGGGVISVMFQRWLESFGTQVTQTGQGSLGFEWLWPPSLPTLYFGRLSLIQIDTLLFSLLLLGPLLFLIPLVALQFRSRWKSLCLIQDGLRLGAGVCLVATLVIGLKDSVGGITRLLDTALLILLIFSFPIVCVLWERRPRWIQALIALNLILLSVGGMATFSLELLAVSRPQFTTFIDDLDVRFYTTYWDRLPPDAQIFDPNPVRASVVFGRSVGSIASDYGQWLPHWEVLSQNPTPKQLVDEGYTHAYLDKQFWSKFTQTTKTAWQAECLKLVDGQDFDLDFRRLYDLRACR